MRTIAAICLAACLAPAGSRAQSISIFADQAGTDCDVFAPPMSQATFYILALPGGAATVGIIGAEFSIAGLPSRSRWFMWAAPSVPFTVVFPDPLRLPGANIGFATCQMGAPNGAVLLYVVHAVNVSDTNDYDLRIQARSPPTDPQFDCPLVALCDAPVFTRVCASGGVFFLNTTTAAAVRPPHTPQPAAGATGVSTAADLAWTPGTVRSCALGIATQSVYFGTVPDPPLVAADHQLSTYDPGPLAPNTTHYWRVTLSFLASTASSPVWSFRTGDPTAVQPAAWTAVKQLFR